MTDTFTYDVFVSYNRIDASFVRSLVALLERAGLRCFQDVSGLRIFDKLDASLKTAVAQSRYVVAIISPSYLRSYWCMFEAMEAIQGQDRELRFLPIVVKYRPDDTSLDEEFVLKALEDLDEEMRALESRIVKLKAYELSSKLDKLGFVRRRLPMVLRTIYERIFPEFLLWNDTQATQSAVQLLRTLAPSARIEPSDVQLVFERPPEVATVVPRINDLPLIGWRTYVGRQTWKNSPVVVGSNIYVGTAGNDWNSPDEKDGVYCLDAESGAVRWFAHTPADANQTLVSKGRVVTGCDDGTVAAFAASDGRSLWNAVLDSGIVAGPVLLDGPGGSAGMKQEGQLDEPILVITYKGTVSVLDLNTGRRLYELSIGKTVIGSLALYEQHRQEFIAVPTEDGVLVTIAHTGHAATLEVTSSSRIGENVSLAARPLFFDGVIFLGLVGWGPRQLAAIDATSGAPIWPTDDYDYHRGGTGNVRGAPVIVGEHVIYAAAYSDGIRALDRRTGKFAWDLRLGQEMFQHWSSPVVRKNALYLGRHDGYVHKVDARARQRVWSIYIGEGEMAGAAVSGEQSLPEFAVSAGWLSGKSSPVLATPCIDRGRLYVGTYEGYLFCVQNIGVDS
jgi:outer membrane protein assembly factor BamB